MATSFAKISEEIQRLYARGLHRDDISPTLDRREVELYAEKAVNEILKLQAAEGFTVGGIELSKVSIATYENQTVVTSSGVSHVVLPVPPILLPMDMGVWEIVDPANPWDPYIPIVGQDAALMRGSDLSFLEGQIGYKIEGLKAIFTEDMSALTTPVAAVTVKEVVSSLEQIGSTGVLPLTADQEITVVRKVFELMNLMNVSQTELNKYEEQKRQMKDE